MAKGKSGPWPEGRRAWQRLDDWRERALGRSGNIEQGEAALAALVDIGTLRRLLDQTELEAVRTARGHRKTWAEIATRLGVSRQSAWERWRDLDEGIPSLSPDPAASDAAVAEAAADQAERARALAEQVMRDSDGGPGESVELALVEAMEEPGGGKRKRSRRRPGKTVVVPNVVGRTWEDARSVLAGWGFPVLAVGMSIEPGVGLVEVVPDTGALVTGQAPEAGARVSAGTPIRLWVGSHGGGSAGVREPRHPFPSSPPARELVQEPVIEAVG